MASDEDTEAYDWRSTAAGENMVENDNKKFRREEVMGDRYGDK